LILGTTPTNAYTQFALNGINSNSFVRFYTADNALGQANPTDVRSGVSYASGNLTGRLTVPARGSVALSVNYGPSMPFTATRSGTTATATLAYSYPLVVGDQITVTSASNTEWNSTYTIASVVSGTSVTFTVPNTHSATAGTGALMQTTGTAVLDPASIASAVQNALTSQGLTSARAGNLDNLDAAVSSRLAPSGTLATVTTLTNAPTVPTPSQIASQVRTELSTELGRLDVATSTRSTLTTGDLPSVPSAASVASAVRTELTELSNLDASVSSRLASAAYTAPTSAPTAAAVASAVRAELTELSNLDATISSRLADADYTAPTSAPSASTVATAVRTELGTELGRIDQSISSRLASADYTTPPTPAQISAAVEGSLLNEADGQAVLNALVGAIGNQNVDEIALVAAVRADLERTGGKIDSIPTTAAPTAAQNASAVWGASAKVITGGVVDTLTNAPASVTPSDIWSHSARTLTSASGPTAVEIRQEIDANSTKLDVAVGTRLADADYVEPANSDVAAIKAKTDALPSDPADQSLLEAAIAGVTAPTAGQVASQVRTELSVELGRIDAAISSRLAPSGTLATVTTLTNAPTVPTAAAIADEVRVELATELARIDAPVSGATAPSAATVASQVRTELTAELAKVSALNTERLANVATTAIVGNLIAQANS
jgi:hypothetical protein